MLYEVITLEHPDEIADIIRARYARGLSRELLLFEAERIKPLVKDDLLTIGHMRGERWNVITSYSIHYTKLYDAAPVCPR